MTNASPVSTVKFADKIAHSAAVHIITLEIDTVTGTSCEWKKEKDIAHKEASAGYASCHCTWNNKTVQIIKKKPVVSSEKMSKAAGIGAGAMAGAMAAGTIIYVVVTKSKASRK